MRLTSSALTKLYCLLFFLPLSRPLPLFFPLSVQTATHSTAQSEWGSYADHFFHLSSPPLPLPLLRLWKVCLSFYLCFLMFCSLAELGSVAQPHDLCPMDSENKDYVFTVIQSFMSPLHPGTHPSPSTWSPSPCPGTVTLVLLCSWPRSSIGSP